MITSGLAHLRGLFQDREQVLHAGDLLLGEEDEGVFEHRFHLLGVGHEVGRDIAAVELHAFDHIKAGGHAFCLFNGDNAVLADLVHGLGDQVADGRVAVGGDAADLGDLLLLVDGLGHLLEVRDNGCHCFLDAALHVHGVGACGHVLHAFAVDGLGQHSRGRGAVAGHIRGLARDFANELGAHVFIMVLELDFFCHGHAVFGDGRGAEFLVDHHVAALGAERGLYGVGQDVHASSECLPGHPG